MKMTERLERRKISELIPYANNARTHSPAQIELLRRSLREFGFVSPVLIDAAGNVIAGHGRIEAARLEGIEEAPCVLVEHLSDAQRRAYILADNRLSEAASWNDELVSSELLALRSEGMDITLTGFAASDIALTPTDDVVEDDCDLALPEAPLTKPGQLWELGRHRLLCGDATSPPPRCTCAWAKDSLRIFFRPIRLMGSVIRPPPARFKTTRKPARLYTTSCCPPLLRLLIFYHRVRRGIAGPRPDRIWNGFSTQRGRPAFLCTRS